MDEPHIEDPKSIRKNIRLQAFILSLSAALILTIIHLIALDRIEKVLVSEAKAALNLDVSLFGSTLTQSLNTKTSVIHGLNAYLQTSLQNEDVINQDRLAQYSQEVYQDTTGILNIAVAPGGVFQYVYPYEKNSSVIGYEPAKDDRASVREDVARAIESGEIILSLPIELIQGGLGVIARQAIFIDEQYWGLSSIVIEIETLMKESGFKPQEQSIEFALEDQAGQIFYGSESILNKEPVSYVVVLPEGQWMLYGVPGTGWQTYYQYSLTFYFVLGFIIILLLCGLIYLAYYRQVRLMQLVSIRTAEVTEANKLLQEDIQKREIVENMFQHMATHDALTNLPNRDLMSARLNQACELAKSIKNKFAVLFIDLDGFKNINDVYGHAQGDWLLQVMANRLKDCMRNSDTISRLGGDEFAIMLDGAQDLKDIVIIAEKILSTVSKSFKIQNSEVSITCSIGISCYPEDAEHPDLLLSYADQAMYKAKQKGKNNYQFFSLDMESQTANRLELLNRLQKSIENNELKLVYQPQVNSQTREIVGLEALIRWHHPELGVLSPASFIPLAEETGLIIPIGQWVLDKACHDLRTWVDKGFNRVGLTINVSKFQLLQRSFLEAIAASLQKYALPGNLLELDLTENIIFKDIENGISLLRKLKSLNLRLAIDDFGTGYSTLNQLAHFPFDTIKIDQYFAKHVLSSYNHAAVVTSMVNIANNLNFDVVAEGVETTTQLAFYTALGCYQIQGAVFSEPVELEKIINLLENGLPEY